MHILSDNGVYIYCLKKKNNKNFEEKNILPSNENIEVGTDSGFDDLMYDNLESDYQYFDGNNFDDEKVEKPVSEELMLVETGDNIILYHLHKNNS